MGAAWRANGRASRPGLQEANRRPAGRADVRPQRGRRVAGMALARAWKQMSWFYYQYLLVTALYMLEPWERTVFSILPGPRRGARGGARAPGRHPPGRRAWGRGGAERRRGLASSRWARGAGVSGPWAAPRRGRGRNS